MIYLVLPETQAFRILDWTLLTFSMALCSSAKRLYHHLLSLSPEELAFYRIYIGNLAGATFLKWQSAEYFTGPGKCLLLGVWSTLRRAPEPAVQLPNPVTYLILGCSARILTLSVNSSHYTWIFGVSVCVCTLQLY